MSEMWYNSVEYNHIKSDGLLAQHRHHFSTDVRGIDTMSYSTPIFPQDLENYAPWVAIHGLRSPYGECQCGCGNDAPIARCSSKEGKLLKGAPKRYLWNHHKCPPQITLREKFFQLLTVGEPDGCWEWPQKNGLGYGYFAHGGKKYYAHRVSYELHLGPIADGFEICHECDNPPCCNPQHLFVGTHLDNVLDSIAKGRQATGERNGNRKLREADVIEIRRLSAESLTQRQIAQAFGVSQSAVGLIVNRKTWKNLVEAAS